MNKEEREEYFNIGNKLKIAFSKLFKPDLYNYATLANVSSHLHTHFIPRYKTKREFSGVTFVDDGWGQNYAPYDKEFKLNEEVQVKIRDAIKEELSRYNC